MWCLLILWKRKSSIIAIHWTLWKMFSRRRFTYSIHFAGLIDKPIERISYCYWGLQKRKDTRVFFGLGTKICNVEGILYTYARKLSDFLSCLIHWSCHSRQVLLNSCIMLVLKSLKPTTRNLSSVSLRVIIIRGNVLVVLFLGKIPKDTNPCIGQSMMGLSSSQRNGICQLLQCQWLYWGISQFYHKGTKLSYI